MIFMLELGGSERFRDTLRTLCVHLGLILGMRSAGWEDVPLVAMETVGADCFNQSLKAGRIIKTDAIRR